MNRIRTLVLLLLLAWAQGASGATVDEIERRIQEAIRQHHPTEGAEWWRALGPEAPGVIMRLYRDSRNAHHRERLLQALAWFDDPVAMEFIREETRATDNSVTRAAGLRTLAIAEGDEAVGFISEFLEHSDPQTRLSAAAALRSIGSARALSRYEEYLEQESVEWITRRLRSTPAPPPIVGLEGRTRSGLSGGSTDETAESPGEGALKAGGRWTGYWIAPSENGLDVRAYPATVDVARDGKGRIELGKPGSATSTIEGWTVQGSVARGFVRRVSGRLPGVETGESAPFEARVVTDGRKNVILQLEAPVLGATFIGRMSPPE